jgi:hypothetical protein
VVVAEDGHFAVEVAVQPDAGDLDLTDPAEVAGEDRLDSVRAGGERLDG